MAQIFPPRVNVIAKLVLLAIPTLPLFAWWGVGYKVMQSPYTTRQDVYVDQPVPFSHEHHVGGLGLDCRYCHASVTKSDFAGLPPTHTCMTCHSQLWTQAPMLAPVRESLAQDRPIHWRRVNTLPDYVYFDHHVHVANGVGCATCHGDVGRMPLMRQAAPLTMGWCLSCHRDPAPNLRPQDAIFDPWWQPPPDQDARGKELLKQYHIDVDHLTDCSVCHR